MRNASGQIGFKSERSVLLKILFFLFAVTFSGSSFAAEYSEQWSVPVDSVVPEIRAFDQDGNFRDFKSLSGKKGLLLVMSRSADW